MCLGSLGVSIHVADASASKGFLAVAGTLSLFGEIPCKLCSMTPENVVVSGSFHACGGIATEDVMFG